MARYMSFRLTVGQIQNHTKTVTRRLGWWDLTPGQFIYACEKCQGLRKGEKVKTIASLRVISTTPTKLDEITQDDCNREGFPEMSPEEFVRLFCRTHKGAHAQSVVNRIEFEYMPWGDYLKERKG